MRAVRAAALAALLLAATAASGAGARVDNFVLLDQHGTAHELYRLRDHAAVVLMIQGNGCPVVRNALPDLRAVRDAFASRNVAFLMLNANPQDDRASILAEATAWNIDLPILDDTTQLVAESLDVVRTAEVLVIDPRTWEVVYRGPIDDRLDYERQKQSASEHWLRDALDAHLAGQPVAVARRDAVGCLLNTAAAPEQRAAWTKISYADTIAPMLQRHCVECHRSGGIGPWAMTSYDMVRGFAPMIREVVRTRRMPPWHADPAIGAFNHDRSLPGDSARQLVHWIEAGAPRGDGADPLATEPTAWPEWPLGEPDLIIALPAFEVPPSGVVDYQFPAVANTLDHDVWVRAVTIQPGDRAVVHHVLAGSVDAGHDPHDMDAVFENYLAGIAPGAESLVYPDGTGVRVPPGGHFVFQMHYTPVGRAATDVTRMGLYFHDQPPPQVLRHHVILDPTLRVPAGDPAFAESAYFHFDRDAVLYSVFPHAHYRGRSSTFDLVLADGTRRTLLSVPRYDFNWQREYAFTEPVDVPAGARLVHTTVYDNSALNPANPDPAREVPWGLQSWDEMLYGAIVYRWKDETRERPVHDPQVAGLRQMFGFMDRDMDLRLQWSELGRMQARFGSPQGFAAADRNGDGGLDLAEFAGAAADRGPSTGGQ